MSGRTGREAAARMRLFNLITRTIITILTAASLHGGIQLGAHALAGGISTDPGTYLVQALQLFGAVVLLMTSGLFAGNVIPLHPADRPPPPLTSRLVIAVTLLAGAALSTAGSLMHSGTAPWTGMGAPTPTAPPDPVTGSAVITAMAGLTLWILACEWIRRRDHHRVVHQR